MAEHTGGRHRITETRPGSLSMYEDQLQTPHHQGKKVNRTTTPRTGSMYDLEHGHDSAARPLTTQQQAWFDDYTKRGK